MKFTLVMTYCLFSLSLAGEKSIIKGDKNFLFGKQNSIIGNQNVIVGTKSQIQGSQNKIVGVGHNFKGNKIIMFGPNADQYYMNGGNHNDKLQENQRIQTKCPPHSGKKQHSLFPSRLNSPFPPKQNLPFPGKQHAPFPDKKHSLFPSKQRSPFPGKQNLPFPGKQHLPFPGTLAFPNPYHLGQFTNKNPYVHFDKQQPQLREEKKSEDGCGQKAVNTKILRSWKSLKQKNDQ